MVKNPPANIEDVGLIPGLGRSSGRGNGKLTPVFLPGESHGQRSLVSYSPWVHKEPDKTEQLNTHILLYIFLLHHLYLSINEHRLFLFLGYNK